MKVKKKKIFLAISIMAMGISLFSNKSFADSEKRFSGENRYETNTMIIDEALKIGGDNNTIIITSGKNYPDALSAGNISYRYKFPLLLEDDNLKDKLEKYNPTNIIIVGGKNSVVNRELEEKLRLDYRTIRISGTDRYETNERVIEYIEEKENRKSKKLGVRGDNFPDALSGVALANKINKKDGKTLLKLSKDDKEQFLKTLGGNVKGISDEEIIGSNRYNTSQMAVVRSSGDNLIVVKGDDFPDALSASSLAGVLDANILLVQKEGMTRRDIKLIDDSKIAGKNIYYIGGNVPEYSNVIDETKPNLGSDFESSMRLEIFELANKEREKVGLYPFKWNNEINQPAQIRASEVAKLYEDGSEESMKLLRNHKRIDGRDSDTAMDGTLVQWRGENLAVGSLSAKGVVDLWMNSEGHRSNILNDHSQYLNVGYVNSGGIGFFIQTFAKDDDVNFWEYYEYFGFEN